MSKERKKCEATIQFGDDYGDNCCTFHCDLEEGHENEHVERGNLHGEHYVVKWNKEKP